MNLYAIYNKTHKSFYGMCEDISSEVSHLSMRFGVNAPWITTDYAIAEMVAKGRTVDDNGAPMMPWGDSERPDFTLVRSAVDQGEDVRIITFEEVF